MAPNKLPALRGTRRPLPTSDLRSRDPHAWGSRVVEERDAAEDDDVEHDGDDDSKDDADDEVDDEEQEAEDKQ